MVASSPQIAANIENTIVVEIGDFDIDKRGTEAVMSYRR
jgi:hypothetical protein